MSTKSSGKQIQKQAKSGQRITDQGLKSLGNGKTSLSEDLKGRGRLIGKRLASGRIVFRFKYYLDRKQPVEVTIGTYRPPRSKVAGLTISQARDIARTYGEKIQEGKDVKEWIREQKEEEQARQQALKTGEYTGSLEHLLRLYVERLKKDGKPSWKNVENCVDKHVFRKFKTLSRKQARDITADDITKILTAAYDPNPKKKNTLVNRLRSYLKTAFEKGKVSRHDFLHTDSKGLDFDLAGNPVLTPRYTDFENVVRRYLGEDELQYFLIELEKQHNDLIAELFKLVILLGGQRVNQVLRIQWKHIHDDENANYIIFPENLVKNKLEHVVPINDVAKSVLYKIKQINKSAEPDDYLFPARIQRKDGEEHISLQSLTRYVSRFCKRHPIKKFTPRDLRRTCKTLMAKYGFDDKTMKRLHNHGLSTVDYIHYDMWDYRPEKEQLLKQWNMIVEGIIQKGSAFKVKKQNL